MATPDDTPRDETVGDGAIYDDSVVTLDDSGITIKNYYLPGRARHIPYDSVDGVDQIELGFATGRHQLVGIGPLRPRLLFHWDRQRSTKSQGLSLDVGRWLRRAITPDDPAQVLALVRSRI